MARDGVSPVNLPFEHERRDNTCHVIRVESRRHQADGTCVFGYRDREGFLRSFRRSLYGWLLSFIVVFSVRL